MKQCSACGWAGLPHRDVCPTCGGRDWHGVPNLSGIVRAFTRVHRAFGVNRNPPDWMALVELDGGGWIVGTGDEVTLGSTVTVDGRHRVRVNGRVS